MRKGSLTWNARLASDRRVRHAAILSVLATPPRLRGLKRQARHWQAMMVVYTMNGRVRDRWPDHRYLDFWETSALQQEALARLERNHLDLYRVVCDVMSEDFRNGKWFERASRLRRQIRRESLNGAGGKVY